ncbi:otefin [Anopheles cruzii]|uniref:otefin n=1 Tax=Anopheles cruzii TaxID=68878 RepID=UPI0022EC3C20|nr:otefin [Anopheles cruzii]
MDESFDELSNDQLRLRLLEYGLSNTPVTSTTRKVLLKKLKNHVSGGTGTPKGRRETIHTTKHSSDEDNEPLPGTPGSVTKKGASTSKKESAASSSSRRATIAVSKPAKPVFVGSSSTQPPVATKPDPPPPQPVQTPSKRRSGRITPVQGAKGETPLITVPDVPPIQEDSDDDMIPLNQLTRRDRKSKSPSLSRAEMLTTSYVHQVDVGRGLPSQPIFEEMEVDPETASNAEIETIVLDDDDEMELASAPTIFQQPPAPAPALKETRYDRTTTTQSVESTRTTYTKGRQELFDGDRGSSSSTVPPSRPTPNITKPSTYRASVATTRVDKAPVYNPTDSPYLSEFTKRLSRLRAEAAEQSLIGGGDDEGDLPWRRTTMAFGDRAGGGNGTSTFRSTYGARESYNPQPAPPSTGRYRAMARESVAPYTSGSKPGKTDSFRSSVRQSILAFDQRYRIQKLFYTVIVLLAVIFIFVFFFL